jgi:hypothetical protein
MTAHTSPLPCRFCGEPTYLSDENGLLHLCCSFWMGEGHYSICPSCLPWRWQRSIRQGAA